MLLLGRPDRSDGPERLDRVMSTSPLACPVTPRPFFFLALAAPVALAAHAHTLILLPRRRRAVPRILPPCPATSMATGVGAMASSFQ